MEFLAKLDDEKIFGKGSELQPDPVDFKKRTTVKAVILHDGLVALECRGGNYYKLPGGGVDKSESLEDALRREIREEVGCEVEILDEVGEIVEICGKKGMEKNFYCYLSKVKGDFFEKQLTETEIAYGSEIVWVTFEKSFELIKNSTPKTYIGHFTKYQTKIFLEKGLEIIRNAGIALK